jgi:hypothetical protein
MIAGGIVISNGDGVTLNKTKQFFSKFVCSRKYAKRYKSSTFGNNDRRISKVLRVGEISCNSRVVIDAQGNFAKDRRMVCSLRAVSWQE